eukprot:TRINITY_DN691_c0_g1_i1.p1 TRINITY_DN691_c0_g1~~TRINITY_DN691_c0_g1_i1.p1  ORF type:complete len:346 (-),score=68.42 TRINITY_DN691_c0_g1_i1:239-1276(-)
MEKYSRWRDKGTGVHPFLHEKPLAKPIPFHVKMGRLVTAGLIQCPLFVIRLILLLVVSFWFSIMHLIIAVLSIFPPLRRGFQKYVSFLGSRMFLLLMGFWWIEHQPASRVRSASADQLIVPKVQSGDLVISNHISFLEIIYLNFRFAPTFAIPKIDSDTTAPSNQVIPMSFLEALRRASHPAKALSQPPMPLSDLLKDAKAKRLGPVVLFPEATTSNGKAVLSFQTIDPNSIPSETRVILMAFKFDYQDFSPAFVVGSFWSHFFKILFQLSNRLQVKTLVEHETPEVSSLHTAEEWTEAVSNAIANMHGIRRVKLGYLDKQEFLAYWQSQQPGYRADKDRAGKGF